MKVGSEAEVLQIAVLGLSPLLWNPLCERYGRRPIFLFSAFLMFVVNLAGGFCESYGSQMATRILFGLVASPPLGNGSAVVTAMYFAEKRAQKLGYWTLVVSGGIFVGPLVFGFVVQHAGLNWLYWTLAITNAIQVAAYLWTNAETVTTKLNGQKSLGRLSFTRLDPTPLTIWDFLRPLVFFGRYKVMIPAAAYALTFTYSNTAITVGLPSLFIEKFHLSTQQIGLQFIGPLIGAIIGEQIGGLGSDLLLQWRYRRTGEHKLETRLWVTYVGLAFAMAGMIIWAVQLDHAREVSFCV